MSPLRWTCKSTRTLAGELKRQGFRVSPRKVGELLKMKGYSLQANRKMREGGQHPDRDAQFQFIAKTVRSFQGRRQPVISVDTKKKELVEIFAIRAASITRRRRPSRFGCTTSRTSVWGLPFLTASTT